VSERMPIEQVIATFDDEALTRTMIATAAQGIGVLFSGAPPRVQAARDRVKALMLTAPDLLDLARIIGAAYPDNPGTSDLDDEQPVTITLGTVRRAWAALAKVDR
jgi:hypothetical protein